MRNGDLSNETAGSFGIRFERVIKTDEGKLNKGAKAFLEFSTGSVDCNIYVITTGDRRRAMAFLQKWAVPHNVVIEADTPLEIPDIVRENHFFAYYDLDLDILQNVNARGDGKVSVQQWTAPITL